jgi:hypothetical protein
MVRIRYRLSLHMVEPPSCARKIAFWRILLELFFVLIVYFAGESCWACLKTPPRLRNVLSDPV